MLLNALTTFSYANVDGQLTKCILRKSSSFSSTFWIAIVLGTLFFAVIWGFVTMSIAREKGRDADSWFAIGFFLGLIGVIMAACLSDNNVKPNVSVVSNFSAADEIKKYKELMDSGVISEREFQIKKEQLLNSSNSSIGGATSAFSNINTSNAKPLSTNNAAAFEKNQWKCVCGRSNAIYTGTCACGVKKIDNDRLISEKREAERLAREERLAERRKSQENNMQ